MKKIAFLSVLFALTVSCKNEADFSKVKVGMKTQDLLTLVGEPNSKDEIPMAGTYWNYDTHLVVVQSDTINEFLTQAEFKKRMEEVAKGIEDLGKN
jgi:hypothetical protein